MKINVSEATVMQINYMVAKCEGYAVGVLTAEDVIDRQLSGAPEEEHKYIKELFSGVKSCICFVSSDGYKSEVSSDLFSKTRNGKAQFSTDWNQAGEIIERESIGTFKEAGHWVADFCQDCGTMIETSGPTAIIAAMRCYIATKLGNEVEVPDVLQEV